MNHRPKQHVAPSIAADKDVESDTALLLIDLISDFDFEDGEKLWQNALPLAEPIAALKKRAISAGVPVIYVNDNFGKWQEDLEKQVDRITDRSGMGSDLIKHIRPEPDDYYILKPQRSGFYETPLSVLLASMKVEKLIIAGLTTDICVLFTAHDAYMRGFEIAIPSDCTAAVEERHRLEALEFLARVIHADIRLSAEIEFDKSE